MGAKVTQKMLRIWRLEILLLTAAMATLIAIGGGSLAQIHRAEQDDADERRVERRVDTLQKAHDDLRLEIERRLTRIETYVQAGAWLLGAIGAVLLGQLGKGLLDLIAVRRATPAKE